MVLATVDKTSATNTPTTRTPASGTSKTVAPRRYNPKNTGLKNSMAKKDKKKETARKSTAKSTAKSTGKSGKKSAAEQLLADSSELRNTVAEIEKQFGEGSIMPLGTDQIRRIEGISTGSLSLGHRPGWSGHSPRAHHRNLRPRVERQDHAGVARGGRSSKNGRHRCFY